MDVGRRKFFGEVVWRLTLADVNVTSGLLKMYLRGVQVGNGV